MKRKRILPVVIFIGAVSLSFLTIPARGETLVGSNVDTRIMLAFSIGQEAVQSWLPGPWKVNPLPKGPFKSANLLVIFINNLLNHDAEGNAAGGGNFRLVALVVPAKHPESGESASFVIRGYGPYEGPGPYKNLVQATVRRTAEVKGANLETQSGSELWEAQGSDGGMIKFRMEYQGDVPKRVKGEIKPHSAVDPSFFRIYRYDQIVDVVRSIPAKTDRVQSYEFKVTMSELGSMFDGSEQLVGIASIPWYARQTFLP